MLLSWEVGALVCTQLKQGAGTGNMLFTSASIMQVKCVIIHTPDEGKPSFKFITNLL